MNFVNLVLKRESPPISVHHLRSQLAAATSLMVHLFVGHGDLSLGQMMICLNWIHSTHVCYDSSYKCLSSSGAEDSGESVDSS